MEYIMHCKLSILKQCLKELRNWILCILFPWRSSCSIRIFKSLFMFSTIFFKKASFSPSYVPRFLFILVQACYLIKKETLIQGNLLQNTSYRGRLVHSVLLINASIMQIQTMTQIQTKNPAAYFNTRPRL